VNVSISITTEYMKMDEYVVSGHVIHSPKIPCSFPPSLTHFTSTSPQLHQLHREPLTHLALAVHEVPPSAQHSPKSR
jgi:hypothetical protein